MSRSLKKLTHKYEYLKLELEELEEQSDEYTSEWSKLFGKYFIDRSKEMWLNEETGELRKEPPSEEEESKKDDKPEKIKKLYRKLSTKLHPDKGGSAEVFSDLKQFYESKNLIELLKLASDYNIDYELDDEHLRFAIDMAISDWNSTMPPLPPKSIETYPSLYLLMHGAAIQCLKMGGIRQSRNQLDYSSGGSSFSRSNKTGLYQSWISLFQNEYEMKKRNHKIAQNINRGYGGVHSEYDFIGFW